MFWTNISRNRRFFVVFFCICFFTRSKMIDRVHYLMLKSAYMHIRAREISFWKHKKPKRWRRRRRKNKKNDENKFIRACWSQLHMHYYSSFWLCLTLTRLSETCHIHTYMETNSLKYQSNFFTFLLLFFRSYLSLFLYVFFHFGKQKEEEEDKHQPQS